MSAHGLWGHTHALHWVNRGGFRQVAVVDDFGSLAEVDAVNFIGSYYDCWFMP